MPPPHLHPRSRMTSSLFATTMIASFFVVALPHVLPCPVPRVAYADGEIIQDENGKKRRRRRPLSKEPDVQDGIVQFNNITEDDLVERESRKAKRECPIPKPGGRAGELLGFKTTSNDDTKNAGSS
ncbi:unnamed protein product [Discula destructiva]